VPPIEVDGRRLEDAILVGHSDGASIAPHRDRPDEVLAAMAGFVRRCCAP